MYTIEAERRRVKTHRVVSVLLFLCCLAVCGTFAISAWSSSKVEQDLRSKLVQSRADREQVAAERKLHQETASKLTEATTQITILQQELATERLDEMRAKAADLVVTGAAESHQPVAVRKLTLRGSRRVHISPPSGSSRRPSSSWSALPERMSGLERSITATRTAKVGGSGPDRSLVPTSASDRCR
jgi:hypothetical protein